MNGAARIVEALGRGGVDTVFGYPGGAIMPLYDALVGSGLRHVLVRHEQAAAHAAAGYALAGDRVGVCIATSGPGATNLVTGLADAQADSVPLVAITGQVPRGLIGTDAFQETDVFGLTLPIVKHSFLVRDPNRLSDTVTAALAIAREGRPGPVLIDVPKDVQLEAAGPARATGPTEPPEWWDEAGLDQAAELLAAARFPVVYAGGGIHLAGARGAFRYFAERLGAPVAFTLKGLGALPSRHPLALGMMGMHGTVRANRTLERADLLVVVGARFDDRATGRLAAFCTRARVLHLDIDPAEVGKLRQPEVRLLGPLDVTLPALADRLPARRPWQPAPTEIEPEWDSPGVCPRDVLQALSADVVTTDVGQHQMWAAQFLDFDDHRRLLTSGGLGTMGFGLPAAIGAQLARPEARVACVSGDGSLMMMIHELATLRRYRLPIQIVLFDNGCLGMVRQQQELFYGNRESEVDLGDNPDFLALAAVFGIPGRRLRRNADVPAAMAEAREARGPFFLHCEIERQANVWPMVPAGCGNLEMLGLPARELIQGAA